MYCLTINKIYAPGSLRNIPIINVTNDTAAQIMNIFSMPQAAAATPKTSGDTVSAPL